MENLRFRQIHLDYHTSEQIIPVGQDFDAGQFVQTLKEAHVNSINCFAKCHHGMIYYDTRFPARHPGLRRNLLREQIDACHAADIKVPIYLSVGFDEYMATRHPEWLARAADGKARGAGPLAAGWRRLCLNTPYVDYVADQTREILEIFGQAVDGLWFDIVGQPPCYCRYCMDGMEAKGVNPENEAEATAYANQVLLDFKKRLTATVRSGNQDCLIFYNSGHIGPSIRSSLQDYTHLDLESLASGVWGYEHFPITVRYAKNLGLEYLGMTGKFHKSWADFGGFKNQPALEYECFSTLAHGAKCGVGDQLHPSGLINQATYQLIGSVFRSIKEKEPWCDHVRAVSEIGVFTPEAVLGSSRELHPSLRGVYRMLEEGHYQFDFIDQDMDFRRYPVIILPDVIVLTEDLKLKLENYLGRGGKILLSYQSGMDAGKQGFILSGMGVTYIRSGDYDQDYLVAAGSAGQGLYNTEYVLYEPGLYVRPEQDTETLADLWHPYFNRTYRHFCSHRQTPVEKKSDFPAVTRHGQIVYFSHPIFALYCRHGVKAYKQLVSNCLDSLLGEKLILTNAPSTAHLNLNDQIGQHRSVLHILHYIPEKRFEQLETIEDIIPLYQIKLEVRLPQKPVKVYCAPEGHELDFTYGEGRVRLCVPEVSGHQMVVFEFQAGD